jgi:hypothetical protein
MYASPAIERGAILVRPGEEALVRDVDQVRLHALQVVIAEAEPVHRARTEVLGHDVGGRHELQRRGVPGRVLHVDRDALLVAVERREKAGARTGEPARVVAVDRLDLDDFGAEVGEHESARRTHHHVHELDDADARQR